MLEFNTDHMLTAGPCPHEMKASAVMCSSVMPEKAKPADQVHTILLVASGREEGLPSRVREW